jgi:hypothetical protein
MDIISSLLAYLQAPEAVHPAHTMTVRATSQTRPGDLVSLRVIHQALQGLARGCKSRIPKRFPLLGVAACCTVLRSRCCQSGKY